MFARAGEDATFKLYPWARAYKAVLEIETGPYFLGANTKVPRDTVSRLREALTEIRSSSRLKMVRSIRFCVVPIPRRVGDYAAASQWSR